MAIMLKNSLFIHVPKCAGRSVTNAILLNVKKAKILGDPVYDGHSRITMGFTPTLGFIRDPVSFLVSLWTHRGKKKHNTDGVSWNWQEHLRLERDCKSDNLEVFLLNSTKQKNLVWDYYMFYLGGHRNLTIGKVENLEEDLINFLIANDERFNIKRLRNDLNLKLGNANIHSSVFDIDESLRKKIYKSEPILTDIYFNNKG